MIYTFYVIVNKLRERNEEKKIPLFYLNEGKFKRKAVIFFINERKMSEINFTRIFFSCSLHLWVRK